MWSSALNFIAATKKGQKAEMSSLAEESIKKPDAGGPLDVELERE